MITRCQSNSTAAAFETLFERGNKGRVARPVEGFVFHYPCCFAPPLSIIRLGDYKLMEHQLTGELKVFNVATDYREKNNLIESSPKKAAELKKVTSKCLQTIDAEDVQDVYRARFAELDRFETMARRVHDQAIERAKGDRTIIAKARERLAKDLARFNSNRRECRANMHGKTF